MNCEVRQPRGLALSPDGGVYVAGADGLEHRSLTGPLNRRVALDAPAHGVTVARDGTVLVIAEARVMQLTPNLESGAAWSAPGEGHLFTAIAAGREDVWVADAGNRVVHRFNLAGKPLGAIGDRAIPERPHGFMVPSPYFDVALGPAEELWIVNPGERRVERCAPDGRIMQAWGTSAMTIEGFCGCCNPTHIAVRADGAFVTSEKGLPRVKLYDPRGGFLGVVAGTETFAEGTVGLDLAVDAQRNVLVLDPKAGCVRVFVEKTRDA